MTHSKTVLSGGPTTFKVGGYGGLCKVKTLRRSPHLKQFYFKQSYV